MGARTVSVNLKKVDFDLISRSKSLDRHVSSFDEVISEVLFLVRKELKQNLTLRSVGVKLSGLRSAKENRIDQYYEKLNVDEHGDFGITEDTFLAKKRKLVSSPKKKVGKKAESWGPVQKAIGGYFGAKNDCVVVKGKRGKKEIKKQIEKTLMFDCQKCTRRLWGLVSINNHIDECMK